MPKQTQLVVLFDMKEQWLCSELSPDGHAPQSISEGEPRHPPEETQFCHWDLHPHIFDHYPKLMTVGEG